LFLNRWSRSVGNPLFKLDLVAQIGEDLGNQTQQGVP